MQIRDALHGRGMWMFSDPGAVHLANVSVCLRHSSSCCCTLRGVVVHADKRCPPWEGDVDVQ